MPATTIINIFLSKGADYEAVGEITDTITGEPIDISGDSFEAYIRESAGSPPVASFSFSFVTDGTDGKYVRALSDTEINALTIERGFWDFYWVQSDGYRVRMAKGSVIVDASGDAS